MDARVILCQLEDRLLELSGHGLSALIDLQTARHAPPIRRLALFGTESGSVDQVFLAWDASGLIAVPLSHRHALCILIVMFHQYRS